MRRLPLRSIRWRRPSCSQLAVALLIGAILVGVAGAGGQEPPPTDIYLLPIVSGEYGPALGAARNITRRQGYDNQPSFLADSSGLLYTSIREGQADSWLYDLEKGTHKRLTDTPESEFSPTLIPGEKAISVVRVEADQGQRLWRFPLGGGKPELLLPDIAPVGYHAWGEDGQLALFVLGEPPTLQLARRGPGSGRQLASDIGRCMVRMPGSTEISFVQKTEDGSEIFAIEPATGEMRRLAGVFEGQEDYAWAPDGELWMAHGSRLFRYMSDGSERWNLIEDLGARGIGRISRMAISADGKHLALVGDLPQAKPPTEPQQ